ncbi:MAG TPA: pantoate--beta-alanine ligase [Opitutaceae bacterium]|nr:pantoate--beta-alanine ligase [Opitutaceae bacterium]
MDTIDSVSDMRALASRLSSGKGGLSLVPTMGALHAGHEALIRAAVAAGLPVVVSIFVNPLSFGSNENFPGYPRRMETDLELCRSLGVAAVFKPSTEEMYPKGYSSYVTEDAVSKPLCGPSRPSHFRGVTTFVAKLINIMTPTRIFVGQRDPQHVAVLRKMAADLNYAVEFVVVATVRETDGLVLTVRNSNLTPALRQEAVSLNKALRRAKEMVDSGVRSTDRLIAEVTHIVGHHNRVRVIYASIVDPVTMETMREVVPGKTLFCIAAWVEEFRLTDNALL